MEELKFKLHFMWRLLKLLFTLFMVAMHYHLAFFDNLFFDGLLMLLLSLHALYHAEQINKMF